MADNGGVSDKSPPASSYAAAGVDIDAAERIVPRIAELARSTRRPEVLADIGPFAGLNASWWGRDSLHGAILFDERMGVQMRPGVTAQFWAGRRTDR